MVTAEIILTGNELVLGKINDTNGPLMARSLDRMGIPVAHMQLVGDGLALIAGAVKTGLQRARLVIVSGGLGPTVDDLTRQAVADALSLPLIHPDPLPGNQPSPMPEGAVAVFNPNGSASGFWWTDGHQGIAVLPGVPSELVSMWPAFEEPIRTLFADAPPYHTRTVRIAGWSEKEVQRRAQDALAASPSAALAERLQLGVTAQQHLVDLHVASSDPEALATGMEMINAAFGDQIYWAGDGAPLLAQVVGDALATAGRTVATAESCTGGGICAALTAIPGASRYVDRGVVSYSNHAKTELLGVPAELINQQGAVSEPVARAMAEGLLARSDADLTLAVTGIAGPSGGTPGKPVGRVVMALAESGATFCDTYQQRGDRGQVIQSSVHRGMNLLRLALLYGVTGLTARQQAAAASRVKTP